MTTRKSGKCLALLSIFAVALGMVSGINAADKFSSGDKTWDTTNSNWGTVTSGPYTTATWVSGDNAIFEGTVRVRYLWARRSALVTSPLRLWATTRSPAIR